MEQATAIPKPEEPVLFDALLLPHRSLGNRGFVLVMGIVAAFSFGVGGITFALGAWPVVGFLGLDLALVYLAFRVSFRSARAKETVRLTDRMLVIERVDAAGRVRRRVELPPYWLKVDCPEEEGPLRLISRGRAVTLGAFLAPSQRDQLAADLSAALHRLRNPRFD